MSTHVFSEIFLHLTWHTEANASVLRGDVERWLQSYIEARCRNTKGVFFKGVGGTDDHIHLAIQIEPNVLMSEFVGETKGASAYETNKHFGRKILSWQRGYGVVSFGKRNLPWVLEYLRNQRDHHAKGAVVHRLETVNADDGRPAEAGCREEPAEYGPPPEGGG